MATPLLEVRNLRVEFPTRQGTLCAVDDLSFEIAPGELLGVVGESGAGKSLTGMAIIGLIEPPGRIAAGEIRLEGERIDKLPAEAMRRIRGKRIGAIFQDPLTSLNPCSPSASSWWKPSAPICKPAATRRAAAPSTCWPRSACRRPSCASTSTRTSSQAACASGW
jgi:ABC-type oligopeptide transport system ATPase subunit